MRHVVFCIPFFRETTLRFVRGVAALPGVRLGLVTQDPKELLPADIAGAIAAHYRVEDALDPEHLLRGVQAIAKPLDGRIDRLVGTLEQLQVPLGYVRDRLGIEGMGEETAKNFRDKSRMKSVLRAAGVPCARHRLCTNANEAASFCALVGFPVVAKPPAGAGAKATFRIDGLAALEEALDAVPPTPERPILYEEFVRGTEHSFDAVNIGPNTVWHSLTRYEPTPLHVLETSWVQWTVHLPREVDHPRYDDIRAIAGKALKTLGMGSGVSHMEWFRRADGTIAISEVGARPPGAQICSLVSYAHEIDFYGAWGRLVVFDEFDKPERRYSAGCAYLRGQGSGGRIKAIHGIEQAQREVGELVVEARMPQVGAEASGTYEGEGYVIVRHAASDVVATALKRLVTLIKVELG